MLYLNCTSGIAGDMLTTALVDLGADEHGLCEALKPIAHVTFQKTSRKGVQAKAMTVQFKPKSRMLTDLKNEITALSLPAQVTEKAHAVLDVLGSAEAAAHQTPLTDIHLHEAADIVVDATAVAWCLADLNLLNNPIHSTPLACGDIALATRHILETHAIPITYRGTKELTTPTGAALAAVYCTTYTSAQPAGKTGVGAGTMDLPWPNTLTAIHTTDLVMLETDVDDVTGEEIAHTTHQLLQQGALDVTVHPTVMKKGRPGMLVRVLTDRPDEHARVLMQQLGTLGVREHPLNRRFIQKRCLEEVEVAVEGVSHTVGMKVSEYSIKPEFDDVSHIARQHNLPYRRVAQWSKKDYLDSTAGLTKK